MGLDAMAGVLADLAVLPDGEYSMRVARPWWLFWKSRDREGWVSVAAEKDGTALLWTTGRDEHFALTPAFSLHIRIDGTLVCYMESAWSMWIKWGFGRGGDIELQRALANAKWIHSRLCGGTGN